VVTGRLQFKPGWLLLAKRAPGVPNSNVWEFPGGKVNPGETRQGALIREWREELGVSVRVGQLLGETDGITNQGTPWRAPV
jgi:mutator protein MutT